MPLYHTVREMFCTTCIISLDKSPSYGDLLLEVLCSTGLSALQVVSLESSKVSLRIRTVLELLFVSKRLRVDPELV